MDEARQALVTHGFLQHPGSVQPGHLQLFLALGGLNVALLQGLGLADLQLHLLLQLLVGPGEDGRIVIEAADDFFHRLVQRCHQGLVQLVALAPAGCALGNGVEQLPGGMGGVQEKSAVAQRQPQQRQLQFAHQRRGGRIGVDFAFDLVVEQADQLEGVVVFRLQRRPLAQVLARPGQHGPLDLGQVAAAGGRQGLHSLQGLDQIVGAELLARARGAVRTQFADQLAAPGQQLLEHGEGVVVAVLRVGVRRFAQPGGMRPPAGAAVLAASGAGRWCRWIRTVFPGFRSDRCSHGSGAGVADRHKGEGGKDALVSQQFVDPVQQLRIAGHQVPVEHPVQQQPGVMADLQRDGRAADRPAQRVRAERQAAGIEGRRAGQHAETLAQQVQGQGRTPLLAAGDFAQHRVLVHDRLVDQAEVAEAGSCVRTFRHPRGLGRRAHAGQHRFHFDHEARQQVGAGEPEAVQRLHVARLQPGMAGVIGKAEQLALELDQHALHAVVQIFGRQGQRTLQSPAHAHGQAGGGEADRSWRVSGGCSGRHCGSLLENQPV